MGFFDSLMDWLPSWDEVEKGVDGFLSNFGLGDAPETPAYEAPAEAPMQTFDAPMPDVDVPQIDIPEIKIEEIKQKYDQGPEQFQSWFGGLEPDTQRAVFSALQMGAGAAMKGLSQKNDQEMRREEEERRREDYSRRHTVPAMREGQYTSRQVPGGLLASRMGG